MKLIPPADFVRMVKAYRVDVGPTREDPGYLEMIGARESRFWVTPERAAGQTAFLRAVVAGMDAWNEMILWPREGRWVYSFQSEGANDMIAKAVFEAAGFPERASGAAIFGKGEFERLLTVLFAHVAFGSWVGTDIFFFPDHGEQLVQIDHHDVVHVGCRSKKRMDAFIAHMKRGEYELPAKVPDWTFKQPKWMDKKG